MTTLTIDVLNEKALDLLKGLEVLNIIRLRKNVKEQASTSFSFIAKYKGALPSQPISEVDKQLDDLRNGWE